MAIVDVATVGGGPVGSRCGALCAAAGLRTLVLEREKFPREKVCGDCLNPACWPVLRRFGIAERVRQLPHGILDAVEFIAIGGRKIVVDLPSGEESEIAVKRSLFDDLLLRRAGELGAHICEGTTVSVLSKRANNDGWRIETAGGKIFGAETLIGGAFSNSAPALPSH